MILDIAAVLRTGHKDWTDTLELPRIAEENTQVAEMKPVDVTVHAVASDGICAADTTLDTEVSYACSRCLETFSERLNAEFRELFSRDPVNDDEEDVHFITADEVEFTPFVEQAINLAIDLKPLCNRDCKGLCPQCGVNLNESTCNCADERIDPRLEVLKGLLSERESE